jgi:hypothetical protein
VRRATLLLALLLGAGAARADCPTRAFVLGSDYSTGTLSVVDLVRGTVQRDVAVLSGDPVARWHDGRLYVVNRYGYDNVQILDPAANYATALQFSVGNGSNPQDVAFGAGHRLYVSRLGDPDLLIADGASGATLGRIGLARFADADGNPEAAHLAVVGHLLFVALGRLVNFVPADTGLVAVVDLRADTLLDVDPAVPGIQAVRLHAANPSTDFVRYQADGATHLLIGCTGRWGALDGGIEDIVVPADAESGGAIVAAGLLATEAALGGDVTDVAAADAAHPYAVISDAASHTSLVAWAPASGQVIGTLYAPGGEWISDAQHDGCGRLVACNGSFTSPGLRWFASPADTALGGNMDVGLPPVGVVFGDSVAVPAPATASAIALGAPWPNPADDALRVALALARGAAVDVALYDVAGRRVLTLASGPMRSGTTELARPLSAPGGRRLASGVYLLHARAGSVSASRRVVVAR